MTISGAAFAFEYLRSDNPERSSPSGGLATLQDRISSTEAWLTDQGVDIETEHRFMDQQSRERLYWHYGYLMGMKYALQMARHGVYESGRGG